MSYAGNPYEAPRFSFAAEAAESERASFIAKTYLHLAGAVAAFVAIEAVILGMFPQVAESITRTLLGTQFGWLIVLGAFMVVSWIANSWANSDSSVGMQYMGLSLYVVAEAIIFVPLLWYAYTLHPNALWEAALATIALFGALTAFVFVTKKDFSFLRGILVVASMGAMLIIVISVITGAFAFWTVFVVGMIALACGYILYSTSNVLHHYRIGQHVAASLALFAAVALLFWYILQLFMSRD